MSTNWTFDPSEYEPGTREIEVVAIDQQGHSTKRIFDVTIDPEDLCGDAAEEPSEGCPSSGNEIGHLYVYEREPDIGTDPLSEEWIDLGTRNARKVIPAGLVTTRGIVECPGKAEAECGEVRSETTGEEESPGKFLTNYFVLTGDSPDDPRLEPVAESRQFDPADFGSPVDSGPVVDVIAPWQSPPPDHGGEYELYEEKTGVSSGFDLIVRWWIEASTGLPLRSVLRYERQGSQNDPEVQIRSFDYDQQVRFREEFPSDFFHLEEPPKFGTDFRRSTEEASEESEFEEELELEGEFP